MDDIEIDISDPAAARRYARLYLWLISIALTAFAVAVFRDRTYSPLGALFIVGVFLVPFHFRWKKIARCLEDPKKAELVACALSQKGAEFDRACDVLKEEFGTVTESAAIMANPTTWGRKQRLFTFRTDGVEVVVCEKNGLVGDLKTYLR